MAQVEDQLVGARYPGQRHLARSTLEIEEVLEPTAAGSMETGADGEQGDYGLSFISTPELA